jgi:energy-coupling factor transporter ATP-binding protein EcfA2
MFRRIRITNFRSCRKVLLENLGSLTALIGRNGSGKTNILQAIAWVARAAGNPQTLSERLAYSGPADRAVVAEIECNGTLYRYSWKRVRETAKVDDVPSAVLQESLYAKGSHSRWKKIIERRGSEAQAEGRHEPIALGRSAPCIPALAALLPEKDPVQLHLRPLLTFFHGVRYYPLDETSETTGLDHHAIINDNQYRQWAEQYREGGETEDSALMRLLYAYYESTPQFDEIQALLGPNGLGLIEKIKVHQFFLSHNDQKPDAATDRRSYHQVLFHLGKALGGGLRSNYSHLSLGTRRVVHLLVSLILDRSSTMLIEHPEDGIHRGLVRKLVNLLSINTTPTQIILSSHSALVVSYLSCRV